MSISRRALFLVVKSNRFLYKRFIHDDNIRNIGILAHIDAGKTTTTERMLFYSGKTNFLGEVHHGNTVTDYLTQERERGITICSSAVTFPWKDHKINLLDTPGHIDFTMEVEQSLYAVDGVVVVLDGSAGVEAQTVTVWTQAEKHHLPKLVFVNKMDRPDSDFAKCIKDLSENLIANPICVQYPLKNINGELSIIDIIGGHHFIWDSSALRHGYKSVSIDNDELLLTIREKRYELVDRLSGIDDELAEYVIEAEGLEAVPDKLIYSALRRATRRNKVVPVLVGAAYKNIGIQPLMDSIVRYLPNPSESNDLYNCFGNTFIGKVFKVIHDKQRGPLALVRIFRGCMKKGMRVVTTRGSVELIGRIYEPLADDYREIMEIGEGGVAICGGLKKAVTGDLLAMNASTFKNAQKSLRNIMGPQRLEMETLQDDEQLFNEVFSVNPQIPSPVYFCSIEPPNLSSQNAMEVALGQLQCEDPSLRVTNDEVTGQTVLGGMGRLHLDIVKSRILTEYKIDVDLGPLQIAYRETLERPSISTLTAEKEIAGDKQNVSITLQLLTTQKEPFSLDMSPENAATLKSIRPRTLQIIKKGALSALQRGPRIGGQVMDTQVKLCHVAIGRGTADSFVLATSIQCVQKILLEVGTRILEPIMSLHIIVPSERSSSVLSDLSRRRALVDNVVPKGNKHRIIVANVPLAELEDYPSALRFLSSGTAVMTMQPCGFAHMNALDEDMAIRRSQGLE